VTQPAIAIVGLGCVLPDAHDVPTFLANLRAARYSISEVDPARWDPADYFCAEPREGKTYSKIGGWVRAFELDGRRYRIPPAAIQRMDEAQGWALVVADQALRDAGCDRSVAGNGFDPERCAVVMGTSIAGECRRRSDRRVDRELIERVAREAGLSPRQAHDVGERLVAGIAPITEDTMPGELPNIVAGRIAQALDLHGPNYTTDAACASALAAVLDGCMLLQTGHADWVVAGGADRTMDPAAFAKFCAIGALSASGSYPFDARASGFVMAEGAGAVVLRRLADAEAAGQRIYAVIRAIAGSSDGRGKGITAPNPRGQETALHRAYQLAGYGPDTIDLVEAHGTSTPIGDATEVAVLARLFDGDSRRVALGSVKSMLGHLKAAAGIASLLKTALALHHRQILPMAGFETPNPRIAWSSTPFYVPTAVEPWPAVSGRPPRAALSSFGFGGTNFHLTLEAAPGNGHPVLVAATAAGESRSGSAPRHAELRSLEGGVLCFAAGTIEGAVAAARVAIAGWLAGGPLFDDDPAGLRLSQVAHEQQRRAPAGPVRLAIAATDWAQLRRRSALLDGLGDPRQADFLASQGIFLQVGEHPAVRGKTAFLFPGQGSQYLGMLGDLRRRYQAVEVTWEAVDRAVAATFPGGLSRVVMPEPLPADPAAREAAEARLTATECCQPAMVAADLALFELFAQHGLHPDMVAGHSLGEYAALVAAGAMSLADAERTAAARGTVMASLAVCGPGAMASLGAPEEVVLDILDGCPGFVAIANRNSPRRVVISGEAPAVAAAVARARERGFQAALLPVSHAFHSPLVAGADGPLAHFLADVELHAPALPLSSNLDGGFYPGAGEGWRDEIVARLARQMSSPVEWIRQIRTLHDAGVRVWVECGPKRALTTFNGEILAGDCHLSVASNHPKQGGIASWLGALARLWTAGLPVELPPLEDPVHTPRFAARGAAARGVVGTPVPAAGAAPGPARHAAPSGVAVAPAAAAALERGPEDEPEHEPQDVAAAVIRAAAALAGYPERLLVPALQLERDLGMDGAATGRLCRVLGVTPLAPGPLTLADVIAARRDGTVPPAAGLELTELPPVPPVPPELEQVQQLRKDAGASPEAGRWAGGTAGLAADAAAGPAPHAASEEAVEGRIVALLSEKTGYPVATLAADLDLEGDLGIDTVKQAEVLGHVYHEYGLPMPEGAALARLNTIGKLARAISAQLLAPVAAPAAFAPAAPAAAPVPATVPAPVSATVPASATAAAPGGAYPDLAESAAASGGEDADASAASPGAVRFLRARPQLLASRPEPLGLDRGVVLLGDDGHGLAAAAAERLRERGFSPRLVSVAACSPDGLAAAVPELAARSASGPPSVNPPDLPLVGVIDLSAAGAARPDDPPDLPGRPLASTGRAEETVAWLWHALKVVHPTRFAAAVSRVDGAHGFASTGRDPLPLALHGLLKSFAHERPGLRVRCYDLDPELAPAMAGRQLVDDLLDQGGPPEIGLGEGTRRQLVYEDVDLEPAADGPRRDDVFVLSGGGGGITAACAVALARSLGGGRFALLGRTPLVDGHEQLAGLDVAALARRRQELGEAMTRCGERPTPVALDLAWRPFARAVEVSRTVAVLEACGAAALYLACDVTRMEEVEGAVARCRRELGAPTFVIHGAGLERSRPIFAKSEEEMAQVLAVKVDGWWNLLAATRQDPVRAYVGFGSVVGRFGNAGQADYAAANAVLSACAEQAPAHRACRHLALGWTAWSEVGMAARGDALQRMARAGVEPLSADQGGRAFVAALASRARGELLVCRRLGTLDRWGSIRPTAAAAGAPRLLDQVEELVPGRRLVAHCRLEPVRHRFLLDHRIDGVPYLPGVLGLEAFAEAAQRLHPSLICCGFEQVAFELPLKLTGKTLEFELAAATRDGGEMVRVDCRLQRTGRGGAGGPSARVHFRGACLLGTDRTGLAPGLPVAPGEPWLPAAEIYRRYFHGPIFQAHGGVLRWTGDGLEGVVERRLPPLADGGWQQLAAAPMILEAAIQNAGLLVMLRRGEVALPVGIRRLRLGLPPEPAAGLYMRASESGPPGAGDGLLFDCEVLDAAGRRAALVEGILFKRVRTLPEQLRIAL
jgi:acyl transferase domain-containing protein